MLHTPHRRLAMRHTPTASRGRWVHALSVLLLGWLGSCGAASEAPAPVRPNVILILADDAGLGDFSCYGSRSLQTPNVDRLAREGMRFTQHYAGSPFCAPTRCTLLTGKHTGRSTVRGNNLLRIGKGETTVAELFRDQGYATACIGKWGLGDGNSGAEPLAHGFDTYVGLTNAQLFEERYFPEFLLEDGVPFQLPGNAKGGRGSFAPNVMLERSLAYIKAHRDVPFFLYLPFFLPHGPYKVPGESLQAAASLHPSLAADSPELAYAAMIATIDDHVGQILDTLEACELAERTLVLFTSDNGATTDGIDPRVLHSNLGQRGHKGQLFEGGIRAPLLVRWSGHVTAGSQSGLPSAFWDYLPTLAELIGAEVPATSTGQSFLPTLLGQDEHQAAPPFLYWELSEPEIAGQPRGQQALRRGPWKALRMNITREASAPVMLFDLDADPGESQDLAADQPELVAELQALMDSAHRTNKRFPLLSKELAKYGNGAWKDLRFR